MMYHHAHDPIVIPIEDPILHTAEHPFCSDPSCPCGDDPELLAEVAEALREGLLTAEEAANLLTGQTL